MIEIRRRATLLAVLFGATVGIAAPIWAQSSALRKRLDSRLDAPPFNRHLWGVAVVDEKGKLVYGRNADRMFIPASNTKLVVGAVASALFSPDFSVKPSVAGSPSRLPGA